MGKELQWNVYIDTTIFIYENEFENIEQNGGHIVSVSVCYIFPPYSFFEKIWFTQSYACVQIHE